MGKLSLRRAMTSWPQAIATGLTVTVAVADNAPASVINTATVAGGGEVNTANNSDDDPTTIEPGQPNQPPVNVLPATYSGVEDTHAS